MCRMSAPTSTADMLVASFRFHAGERISRLSRPYTTEVMRLMTHES